jgi:DNA-binding MarR family transcriptional regulator
MRMQDLLETSGIQHPCDLDLLVFLHRHPRVLLTSEQLAARVGYDLKQVARSLDFLVERGLLSRMQSQTRVARIYLFRADGAEARLARLLRLGSTPDGRTALIRLLRAGAWRPSVLERGARNRRTGGDGREETEVDHA